MSTKVKLIIAALSLAISTGIGAGGGYWITDNHYSAEIAKIKREWSEEREEIANARADAEAKARHIENEFNASIRGVHDEYEKTIKALELRFALINQRMRLAYEKGCRRRGAMPKNPAPGGSDSPPSGGNGFRNRIGERLVDRVIRPAEIQTARLVACQAYIREVLEAQGKG